jgi:hypothetical protein
MVDAALLQSGRWDEVAVWAADAMTRARAALDTRP